LFYSIAKRKYCTDKMPSMWGIHNQSYHLPIFQENLRPAKTVAGPWDKEMSNAEFVIGILIQE